MECRNCPYGKEDFDRRMTWYNKIVEEQGIPNDIYGYETYEDAEKDAEQFLWCDKVGGKVYCFGHCTDAYADIPKHENCSKKKRRNKRERDLKYKNYIKRMCKINPHFPAYYNDKILIHNNFGLEFIDNPNPYYKEAHRGKRSKYLKKRSNKAIRRYKGELHNKGYHCHKIFDFWWEYD